MLRYKKYYYLFLFVINFYVSSNQDALLHAIKEEYVEAVELLLDWEEKNHVPGRPYVRINKFVLY